ncbi:MAG: molybdopterin converting factor subunit 1 [Rhodospirillales bacterium]|jgi:molybdopterin synthase sulfur carrier subunit
MKVIYFAWLREKSGCSEEHVDPPPDVADVAGLVAWLKSRGPKYEEAFADLNTVRVAVNQEHTWFDHPVAAGDEVAFFPPVTGGMVN